MQPPRPPRCSPGAAPRRRPGRRPYCAKLHCAKLHCAKLQCDKLHCAKPHCAKPHCAKPQCAKLHCAKLQCARPSVLRFGASYRAYTLPTLCLHSAPEPCSPTPSPYPIPLILPLPLTLSPTPTRYLLELQSLQDRVPPFPNDLAFEILEAELGRPIAEVYSYIGPEPVAAASLGQVYRATLLDGTDVAVKVQRPGAEATIALDLYILRAYSRTLMQACLLLTTYH